MFLARRKQLVLREPTGHTPEHGSKITGLAWKEEGGTSHN